MTNSKLTTAQVSPSITDLEEAASDRPRYLVFCVGVQRELVHAMRNAYRSFTSQSSSLIAPPGNGYDVKIIGFYDDRFDRVFKAVGLSPNLVILGDGLRPPYPRSMKSWMNQHKPSVMRIDKKEIDPTLLPHEDYYLSIYSVMPESMAVNSWRVSNEIDYGILLNLNYRREIKIEDFDNHVIDLAQVDLDSQVDLDDSEPTGRDTSAMLISNLGDLGARSAASVLAGVLAGSIIVTNLNI
jgi:hypothetical protein